MFVIKQNNTDVGSQPHTRPHSRACGWAKHEHGTECSTNCPTCGGKPIYVGGDPVTLATTLIEGVAQAVTRLMNAETKSQNFYYEESTDE